MREQVANAFSRSIFIQENFKHFAGHVLDVGCGSMPYRRLFKDSDTGDFRPDCEVTGWTGVDIRAVGDEQADAHELPFEDESFDTVLCSDLLQFVVDPARVVRECARVLKPGGFLLLTAYNCYPDGGPAFWGIKRTGMQMLFEQAGLTGATVGTSGGIHSAAMDDHKHEQKYALQVQTDIEGLIGGLDDKFPMMTLGIAQKEQSECQ